MIKEEERDAKTDRQIEKQTEGTRQNYTEKEE
jgi:hypothetical protein